MEVKKQGYEKVEGVPNNITPKAIVLTIIYALLWMLGPILFDDAGNMILGLPLWFWFSCIFAPLSLVVASYIFFYRR